MASLLKSIYYEYRAINFTWKGRHLVLALFASKDILNWHCFDCKFFFYSANDWIIHCNSCSLKFPINYEVMVIWLPFSCLWWLGVQLYKYWFSSGCGARWMGRESITFGLGSRHANYHTSQQYICEMSCLPVWLLLVLCYWVALNRKCVARCLINLWSCCVHFSFQWILMQTYLFFIWI